MLIFRLAYANKRRHIALPSCFLPICSNKPFFIISPPGTLFCRLLKLADAIPLPVFGHHTIVPWVLPCRFALLSVWQRKEIFIKQPCNSDFRHRERQQEVLSSVLPLGLVVLNRCFQIACLWFWHLPALVFKRLFFFFFFAFFKVFLFVLVVLDLLQDGRSHKPAKEAHQHAHRCISGLRADQEAYEYTG